MKIFFPQEILPVVKNKHIFFDTCVLLDIAFLKKEDRLQMYNNLDLLLANNCDFGSVYPVYAEFSISYKESDWIKKKSFFEKLIEFTIPVRSIDTDVFDELMINYTKYSRKTIPSFTDLCLAAAVRKFSNSLILTRDHSDFPLSIFNCVGIFTIHHYREVRPYGFYEYGLPKKKTKKIKTPF